MEEAVTTPLTSLPMSTAESGYKDLRSNASQVQLHNYRNKQPSNFDTLTCTSKRLPPPNMSFKIIHFLAALFFISFVSAAAIPDVAGAGAHPAIKIRAPHDLADDSVAALEHAVTTISMIPEDVIEAGDEAVSSWFAHFNSDNYSVKPRQFWNHLECASAIALFIAGNTNLVVKVKKLIEIAGGAEKVVEQLWKTKGQLSEITKLGPEFVELVENFFGVDDIKDKCSLERV